MDKGFITYCLVVPSCLKSCATLLPLTGRESSIGVWITCRSPAPNVMVLYWLKKREREADKEGIENETRDPGVVLQKIRLWRRGLISGVNPESSVSQRQPHRQSQKLSRYITKKNKKKTQAIPADWCRNGAGPDSMPTALLHHNTSQTVSMNHYGRQKSQAGVMGRPSTTVAPRLIEGISVSVSDSITQPPWFALLCLQLLCSMEITEKVKLRINKNWFVCFFG